MRTTTNGQTLSQDENEIDLTMILQLLWENKWLILFVTFFSLSFAVFYSSKQMPQFQTDVLLHIEDNKQNNTTVGGLSKKLDLGSSPDNTAATHSALIQSRFILEPVIKSLGLDIKSMPHQFLIPRILFPDKDSKIKIQTFDTRSSYINKPFRLSVDKVNHIRLYNEAGELELQGNVGSLLTNSDKSISLKVRAIDAPINTQFNITKQSDAQVMHQLLRRLKIKDLGSKESTGILQISLQGSEPKKMIQILDAIAREAQLKDTDKKSLEASKALHFLYQQLPLARHSLDKAETDLNRYRATSGKIDIKLQAQSLLAQLEDLDKQMGTLQVNKIDMSQRYTTSHPFLIALIRQIEELKTKRQQLEKRLKTLPASDQIAVNLMRDVEVKNSLYLILLSKIQELEFVKAGTISNVRILSYAKLPDEPLPGRGKLIYGGCLIFGLAFSFLIIFIRKLLSSHVDDPHWGERNFNLVNLAIIPYCKEQSINTKKFKNHTLDHIPLLAQHNPRNLAIESLRSLRTTLQVTLNSAPNNIVSILGISPGVGKTFISCNLAWLLAVAGKRVLLIDGDLRRGVLHKNFNLQSKPGLVDLLNETSPLEQVLKKSAHPNLTVLPRGSYIADPSELLMSDKFKELIHSSSQQFDIVLIDTAPILLVTDGALVAGFSGTNYLVMGANAHHPTEILMVMKRLANAGVPEHGSIFNFFKTASKGHRYSKYNAYYYDEDLRS